MAGERNTVQVVVTAKDEASGTLNTFIRQLDQMGREGQKAGAGIRNLVAPLAFELAPALGTTGGALARVAGSAAVMTTGFGALAVAATSLAGLIAGQLTESWKKAREEQEKWLKAMSSGDLGQINAALSTQVDIVRKLAKEYEDAAKFQAAIDPRIESQLRGRFSPGAQTRAAEQRLQAGFGPIDEARREAENVRQSVELEKANVKGFADADIYIRQNRERREAEAERLAKERRDRINQLNRERFGAGDFGGDEALAFLGGKPLSQVVSEQEESPTIQAYRRNILEGMAAGPEELPFAETEKALADLAKDRLATAKEAAELNDRILQTNIEGLRILETQTGLSREQTALLAEQREAAQAIAIEQSSTLIPEEKKVELLRLQVEHSNRLRRNLEEENALAGLAAGFKDVADEAELAGKTMRRFAQETAGSMQRSFSDLFFNVMTGNFKSLEDIGKNFGLSVARSLSDALAQGVSGQITGLFGTGAQAAQSFFGSAAPLGGGLTLPTSEAAGTAQSGGLLAGLGLFGGGGGLLSSSPGAVGQSRQFVDAEFGSPGSAESVGGNIGTGGGGGFNLNAGGVAGLAILAGSIALSASSSGKRTNTQSDFGGALTGASLGLSVGGIYGAAIGAVVGLFASVATSDMKRAEERSQMQRGDPYDVGLLRPHLEADLARVQAAQNFPDLADAVSGALHEAYGGPRGRGARSAPGFAMSIGGRQVILPGGSYPSTMTLNDLAALLETDVDSFEAQIQMGINESTRRQLGQVFEQAVKEQAALIGRLNATQFAYDDVGPGLRRTTILPAGALATADVSGRSLMVDRAGAAAIGLTDAQMDAFIRQFADRNTQTDRIPDFTAELRLQL